MCGRSNRQAQITEEQKKQEAEAAAAKEAAELEKQKLREEELEKERLAAQDAEEKLRQQELKSQRQSELSGSVRTGTGVEATMGSAASINKNKPVTRSNLGKGKSGRRSLFTSSGSGMGYYSRF
tara:strand:+ start:705 stop:1076 length:372 start_codon:yes stop_codon:yes gene_type:complete